MITQTILDEYFCCPECQGGFKLGKEEVICLKCAKTFFRHKDVLILLPEEESSDTARIRARYEATIGGSSPSSVSWLASDMVGDVHDMRVLDVGCGTGRFVLEHLIRNKPKIAIGIDFSIRAIEEAIECAQGMPQAVFVVGDAMKLPVQSEKFDRILTTEVIEHLPNHRCALNELRRCLAPDGTLILSTPNYFNIAGFFKLIIDRFYFNGEQRWTYDLRSEPLERFLTPFIMKRLFQEHNLSVLEFRGSELWFGGFQQLLFLPFYILGRCIRRVTAFTFGLIQNKWLAKSFLKYFGVVQCYRLKKDVRASSQLEE